MAMLELKDSEGIKATDCTTDDVLIKGERLKDIAVEDCHVQRTPTAKQKSGVARFKSWCSAYSRELSIALIVAVVMGIASGLGFPS